ncbi:MAG: transposase [Rubripirellula sp.]
MVELQRRICARIAAWSIRLIEGEHVKVDFEGAERKRSCGGKIKIKTVFVGVGFGSYGRRHILAGNEGLKQDAKSWRSCSRHLTRRGLNGMENVLPRRRGLIVKGENKRYAP